MEPRSVRDLKISLGLVARFRLAGLIGSFDRSIFFDNCNVHTLTRSTCTVQIGADAKLLKWFKKTVAPLRGNKKSQCFADSVILALARTIWDRSVVIGENRCER